MADYSKSKRAPSGLPARSADANSVIIQATSDIVGRMLPYNEEAEQAVVAGMLIYEDLRSDLMAELQSSDFYVSRNAIIFQACCELCAAKAPVEIRSVAEKLNSLKQMELVGGTDYLYQLYSMQVIGASAMFYANMVRSKSMQRQLISVCAAIMSSSYDLPFDQINSLLDDAEHRIFAISEGTVSKHDLRAIANVRDELFDKLERLRSAPEELTGVTTGFIDLDKRTGGLQPSDLIIIAARPSMGKTAFALNIALNAARSNHKVAFFSLEMSSEQLCTRLMSICAKVSVSKVRQPKYLSDEEWKFLYDAASMLNCNLFVDDTPGLKTLDLRAKARRMKAKHGLDLIIVDYLQLMQPSRNLNSRELEISEISRTLKGLAKELDIPVVALSQLNRKLEERTDKRPMLSDLRESGAIEQDADVIMFIYRDDVYSKRDVKERLVDSPAEILISKQRNGPVCTVNLLYKCEYTAFVDQSPEWMPPPSEALPVGSS